MVFGNFIKDVSVNTFAVLVGKSGEFTCFVVGNAFGSVFFKSKNKRVVCRTGYPFGRRFFRNENLIEVTLAFQVIVSQLIPCTVTLHDRESAFGVEIENIQVLPLVKSDKSRFVGPVGSVAYGTVFIVPMRIVLIVFEAIQSLQPCSHIKCFLIVGVYGYVVEISPCNRWVFRYRYAFGKYVCPFSVFENGDVAVYILFIVEITHSGRRDVYPSVGNGQ